MDPNWNYERAEIDRALRDQPADEPLHLKIEGAKKSTRWLNITADQARKIQDILSEGNN